jgi:hypothetical protein
MIAQARSNTIMTPIRFPERNEGTLWHVTEGLAEVICPERDRTKRDLSLRSRLREKLSAKRVL